MDRVIALFGLAFSLLAAGLWLWLINVPDKRPTTLSRPSN